MDPTDLEDFSSLKEAIAPTLTKGERELRDKFVQEYLVDRDELRACIRLGYNAAFASKFAKVFMQETYVLNKLKEEENATFTEEGVEAEKKKIMASLWREANCFGMGSSQAARVAALGKLMAIHGMEAPSRSEITGRDGQPLGAGGVFVVPGLMTTEEWAAKAAEQQAELVKGSTPKLRAV